MHRAMKVTYVKVLIIQIYLSFNENNKADESFETGPCNRDQGFLTYFQCTSWLLVRPQPFLLVQNHLRH
jgi:hypothetical protein